MVLQAAWARTEDGVGVSLAGQTPHVRVRPVRLGGSIDIEPVHSTRGRSTKSIQWMEGGGGKGCWSSYLLHLRILGCVVS